MTPAYTFFFTASASTVGNQRCCPQLTNSASTVGDDVATTTQICSNWQTQHQQSETTLLPLPTKSAPIEIVEGLVERHVDRHLPLKSYLPLKRSLAPEELLANRALQRFFFIFFFGARTTESNVFDTFDHGANPWWCLSNHWSSPAFFIWCTTILPTKTEINVFNTQT